MHSETTFEHEWFTCLSRNFSRFFFSNTRILKYYCAAKTEWQDKTDHGRVRQDRSGSHIKAGGQNRQGGKVGYWHTVGQTGRAVERTEQGRSRKCEGEEQSAAGQQVHSVTSSWEEETTSWQVSGGAEWAGDTDRRHRNDNRTQTDR